MKRILIVAVIIIIISGLITALLTRKSKLTATNNTQTALPTPVSSDQRSVIDEKKTDQLISTVENRPTLSDSDKAAKEKILSQMPQYSTVIVETDDYKIEYLSEPDVFQVEIKTINMDKAREDATNWFTSQGVSKSGTCKLPVQFYLNFDILQQAKAKGITLNPLPPGC